MAPCRRTRIHGIRLPWLARESLEAVANFIVRVVGNVIDRSTSGTVLVDVHVQRKSRRRSA